MPITFDTLEELKEFCQSFTIEVAKRSATQKMTSAAPKYVPQYEAPVEELPKKRGRKPNSEKAEYATQPSNGRSAVASVKLSAQKASGKRDKSQTLTAKIQNAIQKHLDGDSSFTANDIYDALVRKNPDINKQSVITSVLKQMNSVYSHVTVSERPGNGPRPVKLYNAA
jgi:hypothetical protein